MADRKRILIIGGNGFIGINLAKDLSKHHDVTCTHGPNVTRLPGVNYVPYHGLTDKDQGRKLIQTTEPDHVIYAVGSNDIYTAEMDVRLAQHHHSAGATQMQASSEFAKARFIYLSSDVVFSGHGGNFNSHDITLPSTTLGKSKLTAENHVRSRSLNYLIIRSSPLLGRGTLEHPSWVDRLRENELFKKRMNLLDRLVRNPVHVSVLSELLLVCIREDVKNQTLHLGGLTKISEHALALKILQKLKLQTEFLATPDATNGNSETHDYSLNFTQTLQLTRIPALTLNESLDRLV